MDAKQIEYIKSLPTAVIYLNAQGEIVEHMTQREIEAQHAPYYIAEAHYKATGERQTEVREYYVKRELIPQLLQMRPNPENQPHSVHRVFRYGKEQDLSLNRRN